MRRAVQLSCAPRRAIMLCVAPCRFVVRRAAPRHYIVSRASCRVVVFYIDVVSLFLCRLVPCLYVLRRAMPLFSVSHPFTFCRVPRSRRVYHFSFLRAHDMLYSYSIFFFFCSIVISALLSPSNTVIAVAVARCVCRCRCHAFLPCLPLHCCMLFCRYCCCCRCHIVCL